MDKKPTDPKAGERIHDSSTRRSTQELYEKAGIPYEDLTQESLGQTSVLFLNSPRTEQTDEAEASLRYMNQRKSSGKKK
jgi:hypothetical protein